MNPPFDPELVVAWFRANARDLPWRPYKDGYRALVVETMAQQTQISRVMERYPAFLAAFPDVAALAAADEQDVLALWEGMGYYRRAKNLQRAARAVMEEHGGVVPGDVEALRSLPGVGRYTAGAIASMVFGHREAIVDGNVRRVIARVTNDDSPVDDRAAEKRTWAHAAALVEATSDPRTCNEGLMELGALICTPRNPRCHECPLAGACEARAAGTTEQVPAAKRAVARKSIHAHCVVVRRGDELLLEQRPATGLWASLWQPVSVETEEELDPATLDAALPVRVTDTERVESFVHQTTHRIVHVHVWTARTRVRKGEWHGLDALPPMSNAHRRAVRAALEAS